MWTHVDLVNVDVKNEYGWSRIPTTGGSQHLCAPGPCRQGTFDLELPLPKVPSYSGTLPGDP